MVVFGEIVGSVKVGVMLSSNHETECLFIYLLKFREVEHYRMRLLLALDRRWVVQFFYWKLQDHVYFQ